MNMRTPLRPGVRFHTVSGDLVLDLHSEVEELDEDPVTLDEIRSLVRDGTVVLRSARLSESIPPEVGARGFGHQTTRHRFRIAVSSFGIDEGDLLADIEAALSQPALIHSCGDFSSPSSCAACRLLSRVRGVRQQLVQRS